MSKDNFISIVLPNYNGERYLERALASFVEQDYANKELLVVDGKSSDRSHQILGEWVKNHPSVRWINAIDSGISDATNIGIRHAQGNIIGYMGSDDILLSGIFEKLSQLSNVIDFDYIYCNSYTYYIKERKCSLHQPALKSFNLTDLIQKGTIVGLQNIFFRRRVFNTLSFNIENRYSMDYEILLEMAVKNYFGVYLDEVATVNIFDENISNGNLFQSVEAAKVADHFAKTHMPEYRGDVWGSKLLKPNTPINVIKSSLRKCARRIFQKIHSL